jgi:hypothetical protein
MSALQGSVSVLDFPANRLHVKRESIEKNMAFLDN